MLDAATALVRLSLIALLLAPLAAEPARALPFDATAVELVEFTDYQCPFCGRAERTIAELRQQYGPALKVTVRHLPLPFHKQARGAAEAAEAARLQGAFDVMHERLFANQQALFPNDLIGHAQALGLDLAKFRADLASPEVKAKVDLDEDIAASLGVSGTPTFFINGRILKGAMPIEEFKTLIDEEIAEARRVNRRGDAWLSDRLSANNAALWGYLRGGQVPTGKPPKDVPPSPTISDDEVYKVTVDPNVDAYDGPADALVTIVVFSDYQCPFCAKLEPTLSELMTRYAGRVRRVMKHNPLPFHQQAYGAALAAVCAQQQGRFWQMHDAMFANQQGLEEPMLKQRASALGLDMAKFNSCLAAPQTAARVGADMELATTVTARGTPNTFINGRKLTGAKPIEEFVTMIDAELAKAQRRVAEGTAAKDLYASLIKDGKEFKVLEDKVNKIPDKPHTPILGNPRAKVRITVFGDLQCPFTSRLFAPLQELAKMYGARIGIAWKHFPLAFHQQARPAAKAAVCAHEQKKFWPAAERLFAEQKDLETYLRAIGDDAGVGLDLVKYGSCMNRGEQDALIEEDMALGKEVGVRGTPTVFINGRKFNPSSGYTVDAFKPVLDALLAGKQP